MASSQVVHAFFHTNRRLRAPPAGTQLVQHSGWWPDTHDMSPYTKGHRKSLFKREEFRTTRGAAGGAHWDQVEEAGGWRVAPPPGHPL